MIPTMDQRSADAPADTPSAAEVGRHGGQDVLQWCDTVSILGTSCHRRLGAREDRITANMSRMAWRSAMQSERGVVLRRARSHKTLAVSETATEAASTRSARWSEALLPSWYATYARIHPFWQESHHIFSTLPSSKSERPQPERSTATLSGGGDREGDTR